MMDLNNINNQVLRLQHKQFLFFLFTNRYCVLLVIYPIYPILFLCPTALQIFLRLEFAQIAQ